MNLTELRDRLNQGVKLRFRDGEVVDAILLGIDPERDRDLTYEVRRVVTPGNPPSKGTTVGGTCVAKIDELAEWSAA